MSETALLPFVDPLLASVYSVGLLTSQAFDFVIPEPSSAGKLMSITHSQLTLVKSLATSLKTGDHQAATAPPPSPM